MAQGPPGRSRSLLRPLDACGSGFGTVRDPASPPSVLDSRGAPDEAGGRGSRPEARGTGRGPVVGTTRTPAGGEGRGPQAPAVLVRRLSHGLDVRRVASAPFAARAGPERARPWGRRWRRRTGRSGPARRPLGPPAMGRLGFGPPLLPPLNAEGEQWGRPLPPRPTPPPEAHPKSPRGS